MEENAEFPQHEVLSPRAVVAVPLFSLVLKDKTILFK